ncbi:putative ABC transporter ATP-binding protein YheS [Candidatus Rubidus massiliensis]|nr:putative ABC transporter ATP-binding protein YheS [Candidatus Rubidus massiliensis]
MITVQKLTLRFGSKILLQNVDLQLNPGCHYGLVGANGCGKSTFLRLLWGEGTSDKGEILTPTQLKIGTLKQDQYLHESTPILDVVLMGNQTLWDAYEQKTNLLKLADFDEETCHKLDHLEKTILEEGGYAAESRAATLLEGLGIPTTIHKQPLKILSGGYKLRTLLAQVLFSNPDVLLLDEPTNHLDLSSIKWLESYLKGFKGMTVLTSHDRDFLNGFCTHILDLDHETIKVYKGNYDQFEETKIANALQREAMLDKQNKRKDDLQGFITRFKAKSSKARQAQSKLRIVEKLEEEMAGLSMRPTSRLYPHLLFKQVRPSGAVTLKVDNIHKSYGEKVVLKNITFEVERGEKIAFLGINGVGKSTLLEILTQHNKPNVGHFKWGFATHIAYFPQDHKREVNGNVPLIDWLSHQVPEATHDMIRDVLAKVLFKGDDSKKTVDVLSGGETARLILAKIMLIPHNILIFDEPTNHLDMESIEALVEALQEYEGTILFVSHNRHFVANLATRIIELTPESFKDYKCSYEEYVQKRELDILTHVQKKSENSKSDTQNKKDYEESKQQRNLKAQIEKKVQQAEKNCHRIENEILAIEKLLSQDGFYQNTPQSQIQETLNQKKILDSKLEIAMEEWDNLTKILHG